MVDTTQVIAALKSDEAIPQFVDEGFQPQLLLKMKMNDITFDAASSVDMKQAKLEPELLAQVVDPASLETFKAAKFLLVMIDPDAPTRGGLLAEARHLLRKNVVLGQADEAGFYKVESSEPALNPYAPPGPPPFTGAHRYIYLLYHQPEDLTSVLKGLGPKLTQRPRWDSKKWSTQHDLKLVGVTFHTCRYQGSCVIS